MPDLHKRITAILAAVLTYGAMVAPSALAVTTTASVNANISSDAMATLTAMSGEVFKRDFVDWEKETWGEPAQAKINDHLREGMQIGTGNNSWAEVAWPNVKTRAWANTVFAVAPNKRLVYLTGGEMLFRLDKHRKDKDQAYYIWTKVLQARIRGTTVLVQAKGPVTRFTVLEGTVDITNRLDHSRTTIKPGVVYEVVGYKEPSAKAGANNVTYHPQATLAPKKIDPYVTNILYSSSDKGRNPIFQDQYATTNIYVSNSEALQNHPLVKVAGGVIDSLPLIQAEQRDLPGTSPAIPIPLADSSRLNKVIAHGMSVEAVPANADYFIGKNVHLPQIAASELPPKGVILTPQPGMQTVARAASILPPPVPMMIAPITSAEAQVAGESSDKKQSPNEIFNSQDEGQVTKIEKSAGVSSSAVEQDPVAEFNSAPAIVPATCLTPTQNANQSAFQPVAGVPGFVSNSTIVPTANVSSLTGNVGSITNTATTTLSGATAGITGTVSAVAGTAGAIGGVTTVVSPTVNTLGNTLQSVTSGVTGITHSLPVNVPLSNITNLLGR